MRVVVVGGGITGLATAWHLRGHAEVTVLEASSRPGGQVRTVEVGGAPLDVGADAFIARQPHAERLARDLGFGDDDLVAPATGSVQLLLGGRLRPLPSGTVLGVPGDLADLARAGVLSRPGLARAAAEPVLPRRRVDGDRSVADLVGERFGREVVDRLVEPLLGGIYAGSTASLSAAATIAPVWAAAQGHRSLLAGIAAHRRRTASATGPVFRTVRGGLEQLTGRLVDALGDRVRTGAAVTGIVRGGDGWRVTVEGASYDADRVVLAVPAAVAADLLGDVAPVAAGALGRLRTASVATVALAYERTADAELPAGSGVLVPRIEGRLVKAITFASRKWPHHAERDVTLLRASVGRIDDDRHTHLDDRRLAEQVDAEVRDATGLPRAAVDARVQRWTDALPQYDVGHLARVAGLRRALAAEAREITIAGAAFDGVGLASRARDAAAVADDVLGAAPRDAA